MWSTTLGSTVKPVKKQLTINFKEKYCFDGKSKGFRDTSTYVGDFSDIVKLNQTDETPLNDSIIDGQFNSSF